MIMGKHKFSSAHVVHSDAYTREEREQIARNIIKFAERSQCETAIDHDGVMVIKRSRLTLTQLKWLGVIHDDVLCKIEHK